MSPEILVCFAVPQEAKPFLRRRLPGHIRTLVTGMGARNAEQGLQAELKKKRPAQVFTCGFAGGLDPALRVGDVLFDTESYSVASTLSECGATQGTFHCAERIAITPGEKAALFKFTGASAVEMESGVIRALCHAAQIPCATVRVISDSASDALPLDFNALVTKDLTLSPAKLAWAIATKPTAIPGLIRLGKNSAFAADRLAAVLSTAIR